MSWYRIPESEQFGEVDTVTWLYWMYRAVHSDLARVAKGELPESFDGVPVKSFFTKRTESPTDKLTAAIERQSDMLERQTDALTKLVSHLAGGK